MAVGRPLDHGPKAGGRPARYDRREIVNGILYVTRTGCSWRSMPHDLPSYRICFHYFRLWQRDGTWETADAALREKVRARAGKKSTPSAAIIDSQTVKTTEQGGPRGYDGLASRSLVVPDGMNGFRHAEVVLVLHEWPADPAEWEADEWRWPVDWVRTLAEQTAREGGWLGDRPGVIRLGEPLGPNTALTAWMIGPGRDPFWPLPTDDDGDDGRVVLYTLVGLHEAEAELVDAGRADEVLDRLDRAYIGESLVRDRRSVV